MKISNKTRLACFRVFQSRMAFSTIVDAGKAMTTKRTEVNKRRSTNLELPETSHFSNDDRHDKRAIILFSRRPPRLSRF